VQLKYYRSYLPLLAVPLFCAALCPAAIAADGVDCVTAAWRLRNPQETQTTVPILRITLNNRCAKDVTAVAVVLRDPTDDSRTQRTAVDWLVRLAYRTRPDLFKRGDMPDILRQGASEESDVGVQPQFVDPSSVVVSVNAVIFADGTWVGDPKGIEMPLNSREHDVTELQEELDVLARLSDYDHARAIIRGRGVSVSADVRPRLDYFANRLEQSDSAAWAKFVVWETQLRLEEIATYRQHVARMKEQLESK
jgi:hypothetical protein